MAPLQPTDPSSSAYERPTQPWVCGHAATGHACRLGPGRRGECRTTAECAPRRHGDRWECTRSQLAGGACETGPNPDGSCCRQIIPCVPVRSLKAKRGRAVWLLFAAVIGALALLLNGGAARKFFEPGPLAHEHAAIADCDACHGRVGTGAVAWLHAALKPAKPSAAPERCLTCHSLGDHPAAAHSRDPAELARVTAEIGASLKSSGVTFRAAPSTPILTCSDCHQEHRGAQANLRNIGDSVCKTCHLEQFASFSAGHPEFRNYPYKRRTRLIFDHAAHYNQHFAKSDVKLVPKECTSCHVVGPLGRVMALGGFKADCAACHQDQIRGKALTGDKGIAVVTVPELDLDTLQKRGVWVGQWPASADGELTGFTRMLLSATPEGRAAFASLGTRHLNDLQDATDEQLAAAARVAWAFKALLHDLAQGGQPAVAARMEAAVAGGVPEGASAAPLDDESTDLLAGISKDMVDAAEQSWFPDLDKDLDARRAGRPTIVSPAKPAESAPPSQQPSPDDASHADILGGGILGSAPPTPAPAPEPAKPAGKQSDILGGDILGAAPAPAPAKAAAQEPAAPAASHDDILGGGGDILGGGAPAAPVTAAPLPPVAAPAPSPPMSPDEWVAHGGWYRQDFTLFYRPVEHEDRFMHAWLDVSAHYATDSAVPVAAKLLAALADPAGPGACMKCHSVDQQVQGLRVNWRGRQPNADDRGATKFSHQAHLSLMPRNGCDSCHVMAPSADTAATYHDHDPHSFAAGFLPIKRETCAACHAPQKATDSCIACHSYHVGEIPLAKGISTMKRED